MKLLPFKKKTLRSHERGRLNELEVAERGDAFLETGAGALKNGSALHE